MLRCIALLVLAACGEVHTTPPEVDFGLRLIPESMRAIPGQRCVVLVQTTMPPTTRSATIAVDASAPFNLVGRELPGGRPVSEIEIDVGDVGPVTVRAVGSFAGQIASATGSIELREGVDEIGAIARVHLDSFVPFLEEQLPDAGIDLETRWLGAPVEAEADVARYLFFSTRWEAGVSWRDGWAHLYLRRRFAAARPSLAYRLGSHGGEPVRSRVPETVYR